MPLHVSSTCAYYQEVKIALNSLWYHHTSRLLIVKQKLCASSWLITEMHGQQNVKTVEIVVQTG